MPRVGGWGERVWGPVQVGPAAPDALVNRPASQPCPAGWDREASELLQRLLGSLPSAGG